MTWSWFTSNADRTGLNLGSSRMLIIQDLILGISVWTYPWLPRWLGFIFFENSNLFELSFFFPKVFLKLLLGVKPSFHSTFLFQANVFDAICECYAMYDFVWMKCLCIKFTFMVLFFIKIYHLLAHAHFMGRLVQFLSFVLESVSISMLASHAVSHFSFSKTPFLFNPLSKKYRTSRLYVLDFTTLALSINFAWIMKNH